MRRGPIALALDPGWLFVVAGLVLVASAVLVPASYDLWVMRTQLAHLEAREAHNDRRLAAYSRFISDVDRRDPQLVRRLVAAQLGQVPIGERPILVASTAQQTPMEWVESTVEPVRAAVVPFPDSLLSRLTLGRKSLWIAGAGVMCIFLGILSAPIRARLPRRPLTEWGGAAGQWLGSTGAVPPAAAAAWGAWTQGANVEPALAGVSDAADSATAVVRLGGGAPVERDHEPHGAD